MSTFPVIDSTLSAKHLAVWAIEKYNLPAPTTCRLLRTNMNHTYVVSESATKYILRVYSYNRRTLTDIAEEVRLLNLLKESGIAVSYPIPDTNNTYIHQIHAPEGIRYAVLFSFANGGKIRNLTGELCYQIGSTMARMHQVTLGRQINRITYTTHTLAQVAYQQAKVYFPESLPDMQFIQASARKLDAVFKEAAASASRTGVVHLDI